MTWLVTGGSGFLGGAVLQALRERGESGSDRVVALGRHHPGGWPLEDFVRADLDDREGLQRAIARIAPSIVIHAAGKTPPAPSSELYTSNTRATAFLLHALHSQGRPCRVVLAGSAAELGPVPSESLPVDEIHPCRPRDAYGLSKWAATKLGMSAKPPLEVISARIFNPIGPGLPTTQAFGRFAALLAAPGHDPVTMSVGGLDARRDFIDVRDVAEGMVALAQTGRASTVYNIGTGISHTIGEGLEVIIRLSGRDVDVEVKGMATGPSDSRANIGRILTETTWAPQISWEQSLRDLWDHAKRSSSIRHVA